jgi:hypothetical protein
MNGQGQQNPSTMSLPFQGTSVTPTFSSTTAPYPSQPYLDQRMYYSYEPDPTRLIYEAIDPYYGSHSMPSLQSNTNNGISKAHPSGLSRFQHLRTSVQVISTQTSRAFHSPEYSGKLLGTQDGTGRSASPQFDDLACPLYFSDSSLNCAPSMSYNEDANFVMKRYDHDLHSNNNGKRLFSQKYFQNNPEHGQMTIPPPFQVQTPPKLNSSIPRELPLDWVDSDFDLQVDQGLPFFHRNNGQRSNLGIAKFQKKASPSTVEPFVFSLLQENNDGEKESVGIEKFQKKHLPSTIEPFDFPFEQENSDGVMASQGIEKFQKKRGPSTLKPLDFYFVQENNVLPSNHTTEDFEISFQNESNEDFPKDFPLKYPVPVAVMEEPLRQIHETKTNDMGGNAERELLNTTREMHDNSPSVSSQKPRAFQQQIRFFNEGVEVDMKNRPLPRPSSLDSMESSTERESDDDDVNLTGKTSMWAIQSCNESK